MLFLNILLIFLVILLSFVIVSSIIKFSINSTSKIVLNIKSYILPSILSFLSWIIIFIFWSKLISKILNLPFYKIILNSISGNSLNKSNDILGMFFITIGFCVCGIILQAFSYLTINIKYKRKKANDQICTEDIVNYKFGLNNALL
ncbi:MAG: hypothetical protein RSA08_01590, partial [Clostridia bacterium]